MHDDKAPTTSFPTTIPEALLETPPETKVPIKKAVTTRKTKRGEVIVDKTKMDLFLEEYLKNNGNGTEAALKVFNTTSRTSAAAIAHIYLKRAQNIGRIVMEKKGMGYGNLIDMAKKRMENDKSQDFVPLFDRMMKIGGYEDFLAKQGVNKTTINVMGVQKQLLDDYVEGEYVEDEEYAEDEE